MTHGAPTGPLRANFIGRHSNMNAHTQEVSHPPQKPTQLSLNTLDSTSTGLVIETESVLEPLDLASVRPRSPLGKTSHPHRIAVM